MMFHVFKKELKDTFRDRKTIFLTIIIPILFSISLVFFMDQFMLSESSTDTVTVVANKEADSVVIDWIESTGDFAVHFAEDPSETVKKGDTLVGMIIQENFSDLLENKMTPEITFFIEPSSTKASTAIDRLLHILSDKKHDWINAHLLEANVNPEIMEPFHLHVESISGDDDVFSKYAISIMAQIVIIIAVLVGGLPAASDLLAGEKERNTMEALLMTPVKRIHILAGKWLTISSLSMMSGLFSVIALVGFVQLFTTNMKEALDITNHLPDFIGGLTAGIVVFSLLVAALQMVLSLMANNMKEAQSYITPITMLAMIPYFVLIDVSAHELTATYFVIPFMNINALIKQLIYGVYDLTSILLVVGSSAIFIVIIFAITALMFSKDRWVLGKD